MKRISKSLLALLMAVPALFTTNVMAQELKKPTMEDLIPGGETYRYAENKWYQWYGDQLCLELGMDSIKGTSETLARSGKEITVCTLEEINRLLEEKGLGKLRHFYNTQVVNLGKYYNIGVAKVNIAQPLLLFNTGKHRVLVEKTSKSQPLNQWEKKAIVWSQPRPQGAANEDWNEVSRHLAYTQGNNLYVLTADGQTQQVTDEPTGIVCGQSVHRNEFGIYKGTFWSPKGELLAFYRMDESMVTEYPLVDITARIGELNPVRYPMAGMTSHKVQVGIYNPATQKTLYLNTGDPTDRYFTNISWAPDSKSLFLIELNRDQNHAKLCQYDAETGELQQVLLEERHAKYVEPQNPILFLPWDSNKFIYQSQRDGYNHLYLYDLKKFSAEGVQLTQGDWIVKEIVGFNQLTQQVIILSTEDSPLQSNLYTVSLKNGERQRIGDAEGVHSAQLSGLMGMYLIDRASYSDRPRVITLRSTNPKKTKSVTLFNAENPYKEFAMPSIETGTLKAADGKTDLYYRIVKPADFDPAKKYPAIVYVYGGPHAQLVTNGFMNAARGWDLYMANKGYIMFTVDGRGSSNRGLEFENATFRQLGIEEGKDQVKGVEFLKSLPYVDGNRIGVHGWSFGGHMTTALMLRYPEIFKVGVAGGPVIDWSYYEVMYGERYMDTPQTNPEGYKATNLKNLAGNLKGHLLIIHDDHDDTCVPQHTLSFMKACIDARTYPDLFIYPTHKHNVAGRDRVHLHEKITRYFEDYL
ncbi:DPP IV N-terminal domain-containing protein [uncultured Bacteroides sp.]|uniref:S9 family peptidase n=1 Tax=uncultured Bacteroides sp. TaxID=162156 RepID=UPI0026060577|nr:DPP IV N-terminal domain-containing protein [uncultured Bacteroides sp.]